MLLFIKRTCFFIIPIFTLHSINVLFYKQNQGDLVRVGYLYSNPSPKEEISAQYSLRKYYTLLSELDINNKSKFDVVTIGDSFSEQDSLGYKNFLAEKGNAVLHINRAISGDNPIQTLIQLLNSNLFNQIQTDYIVLQCVERNLTQRCQKIDFKKRLNLDLLFKVEEKNALKLPSRELIFFSEATLKVPLTNLLYLCYNNPPFSQTYKFKSTNRNLFTHNPESLLFYEKDFILMSAKNDSLGILKSINVLEQIDNLLHKRNMKLIVLISPDKYDMYYPFIDHNSTLEKPNFFPVYENTRKKYSNVNAYSVLLKEINTGKDIYYYDDSHWSPKGAKIIAEQIDTILKNDQNDEQN
jgi:hypothetical protein